MTFSARLRRLVGPVGGEPFALLPFTSLSWPALQPWRRRATLRRAWGLLSDFKYEQTDPDIFYGHLAEDTVSLIKEVYAGAMTSSGSAPATTDGKATGHKAADGRATDRTATDGKANAALSGKRILDVGGGPGYFGVAFAKEHAEYYTCEPDVGEMAAAGIRLASSVRGSGLDLPFRNESFDITYSSNVAEHVPEPWRMLDEMLRVTSPGGVVIYSYTCWLGPFGGHETGLWPHYIGGEFAARRYRKQQGHEPKNRWGESLFDVSCGDGLAASLKINNKNDANVSLVAAFPRYHPWWAWWMVDVPVLREFFVSNLVLVFRKNT